MNHKVVAPSKVKLPTSLQPHGVTGGGIIARRERIHRGIPDPRY